MIESALDISRFNLAYWYMQHNKIGIEPFSETLSLSELQLSRWNKQALPYGPFTKTKSNQ